MYFKRISSPGKTEQPCSGRYAALLKWIFEGIGVYVCESGCERVVFQEYETNIICVCANIVHTQRIANARRKANIVSPWMVVSMKLHDGVVDIATSCAHSTYLLLFHLLISGAFRIRNTLKYCFNKNVSLNSFANLKWIHFFLLSLSLYLLPVHILALLCCADTVQVAAHREDTTHVVRKFASWGFSVQTDLLR